MSLTVALRRCVRPFTSPPEWSQAGAGHPVPCAHTPIHGVRATLRPLHSGLAALRPAPRPTRRAALAAALLALPLLAALAPSAQAQAAPECTRANSDGSYTVPNDWPLKPSLLVGGGKFRLLFITSTTRDATATDIDVYNAFVQTAAKAGHAAISDSCATLFKVVGSTAAVSARRNTGTTGTGVPIYWLNGAKLADDYADFYDGGWDSYGRTYESGVLTGNTPLDIYVVLTGTRTDGTKDFTVTLGPTSGRVTRGHARAGENPLDVGGTYDATTRGRFYALSPVFSVESIALGFKNTAVTAREGAGTVDLTVVMSKPRSGPRSFTVTTADDTAGANADYTPGPYPATIPAGETQTTVSIGITNDNTVERRESFTAQITDVPADLSPGNAQATITIVDNDGSGRLVLTPSAPLALAEGGSATYSVELAAAPTHSVTVAVTSDDPDVTASPATLTFGTGDWNVAQTVTVTSKEDADIWDGTATLTHTTTSDDAMYDGSASSATLRVAVTDTIAAVLPPTVSFRDAAFTLVEDAARGKDPRFGQLKVTIVLSHYRIGTSTVTVTPSSIGDDTAVAGTDYEPGPFRITIPGGETEATAYLKVLIDDNSLEEDETFTLTLTDPSGDLVPGGQDTATVTVEDNEYTVSVDSESLSTDFDEDAGHAEIDFVLSRALRRNIRVDFRYEDFLGAEKRRDYWPSPAWVEVPAGETRFTLRIPIIDDERPERSGVTAQAFRLWVHPQDVPDGQRASFWHIVGINDNDGTIELSTTPTLYEGQTKTITIENISPETWGHTSLATRLPRYRFLSGGTATHADDCAGVEDYNSAGTDICLNSVAWDWIERTFTAQFTALRDRETEGRETVTFRLDSRDTGERYDLEITITDQPTEVLEIYNKERDFFWCEEPLPEVTDVFPGKDYEDLTDEEILQYLEAIQHTKQVFPVPEVLVAEWDRPSYEAGQTATIRFRTGDGRRSCGAVGIEYHIYTQPATAGGEPPIYLHPPDREPFRSERIRQATISQGKSAVEVPFALQAGASGTVSFNVISAGRRDVSVPELKDGAGNVLRRGEEAPPATPVTANVTCPDPCPSGAEVPPPEVSIPGAFSGNEGDQAGFTLQADPAPPDGETLEVDVTITAEGDFGVETGPRKVTIGSDGYAELVLDTTGDDAHEPDGTVTLTIEPRAGYYTLGLPATLTTNILDDDDPVDGLSEGQSGADDNEEPAADGLPAGHPLVKYADLIARIETDLQSPNYPGEEHDLKRVLKTLGVAEYADYNGGVVGVQEATNRRTQPSDNPHWEGIAEAIGYAASYVAPTTQPPPPPPTPPAVSIDDVTVIEGVSAQFNVSLDKTWSSDVTVDWSTADGTATAGSDYTGQSNRTVTITAGQQSATVTVQTTDDSDDEPNETFTVTLSNPANATLGAATGEATITDNDEPPEPEVTLAAGAGITEGGDVAFTLTATPAPGAPLAVGVTVAVEGDFGIAAGTRTVTIPTAGNKTLTLGTEDDEADEADGSVSVTLNGGAGYRVGAAASGTVVIADDDAPAPVTDEDEGSNADDLPASHPVVKYAGLIARIERDMQSPNYQGEVHDLKRVLKTLGVPEYADYHGGTVGVKEATNRRTQPRDNPHWEGIAEAIEYALSYAAPASTTTTTTPAPSPTPELPTVSIDDARAPEGERMGFTIRLSASSERAVDIVIKALESSPVSARANADFIAGRQEVTFEPGETVQQRWYSTLDDSHDDGGETFEVHITWADGAQIGDGVAVGTIENADPLPAAFLTRFGRSVAEQVLGGIAARLAAPRTADMNAALGGYALGAGGFDDPVVTAGHALGAGSASALHGDIGSPAPGVALAGQPGADAGPGSAPARRTRTLGEVLLGSHFAWTGAADAGGGSLAVWSRASQRRFDGAERGNPGTGASDVTLNGTVTTGLLGTDYARDDWLVGLALTQSVSEGGYASPGGDTGPCPDPVARHCEDAVRIGDGEVGSSLTAAIPYAALNVSERLELWGAAGYGIGEVELVAAGGEDLATDIDWTLGAAGLKSGLPGLGGTALALVADALWTRTASNATLGLAATDGTVSRLRLGLEGSRTFTLPGGSSLAPKLELGARHDGGDAETGFGVELGGGIAWSDPRLGLSLDIEGRALISHEDGAMMDRGFSAALTYDPRSDSPLGLSLALRQELGAAANGGLAALFADDPLVRRAGGYGSGQGSGAGRWTMEAGYGLPSFGGRFVGTPHLSYGASAFGRDAGVGWQLAPEAGPGAPQLSFGVLATRRDPAREAPDRGIRLEFRSRW